MPLVAEIKRAVAKRYRIPVKDLEGRCHKARFARPRQIAIALSCELTRHSLTRIGHFFDRDHTTVIHARREVAKRAAEDLDTMATLMELRHRLAPVGEGEGANG